MSSSLTSAQQDRGQAIFQINAAFENFKGQLSSKDEYEFQNTALQDVWKAVGEVEKRLAAKGESRSFRRMKPLLDGLQHYSGAVEVLCNGTMYLPWIWAPIKLCIQIAADHISALEKLTKAYADIGDALPRFDRLGNAFRDEKDFHAVLATVYTDLIEFHRRAYKLFTDSAWKRFFNTSWTRFDSRFAWILESLKRHSELVDKEANAMHIASLQDWRRRALEDLAKTEKERSETHFRAVITWFDVRDFQQEDLLDSLVKKCHPGTADWFLRNNEVSAFASDAFQCSVLWVRGKPGSGKSVLCAQLIQSLLQKEGVDTAYYLCSMRTNSQHGLSQALRSIAAQLARGNQRCAAYIYDEYVASGLSPSIQHLKSLISSMLPAIPSCRIVIDGLDECPEQDQKGIISHLMPFCGDKSGLTSCKLVIFSQDMPNIRRFWKRQTCISLSDMKPMVDESIKAFVHQRLGELRQTLDMEIPDSMVDFVQQAVLSKADGMFLWVHLVLVSLENTYSLQDLRGVVESLPDGIDEAYNRILHRLRNDLSAENAKKVTRIFSWVILATRPLRAQELLDGVSFCTSPFSLDVNTRLRSSVIDLCKPLVDISAEGVVSMVHFSAKEYLLDHRSGPFLTKQQALQNVALGCAAYVNSSLDLIDQSIPEIERIKTVALGSHNLHGFAYAHWLDYLVQLAQHQSGRYPFEEQPMGGIIEEMCRRHSDLMRELQNSLAVDAFSPKHDSRFDSLKQHGPLHELALNTWEDERALSEHQLRPGIDQASTRCNRTLWSRISYHYESTVIRLLDDSILQMYPDMRPHLSSFRSLSEGFSSQRQRKEHERSHWIRLMCREPFCQFATSIGFGSAAQLEKHMQKYHTDQTSRLPVFADNLSNHQGTANTNDEREESSASHRRLSENLTQSTGHQSKEIQETSAYSVEELEEIGNELDRLDLDRLPSRLKTRGNNWNAVHNPRVERKLDISLVHTLPEGGTLNCMDFSPNTKWLAISCDSTVNVYNTNNWLHYRLLHAFPHGSVSEGTPQNTVNVVAFSPDNQYLATGSDDGVTRVWIHASFPSDDHEILYQTSRRVLYQSAPDIKPVSDLAWLDSARIVFAYSDGYVLLWNFTTRTSSSLDLNSSSYTSISISSQHKMAMGSYDTNIYFCDPTTPSDSMHFKAHALGVSAIHFTEDGSNDCLVSASFDRTIKLWNPGTKSCYRILSGHTAAVVSIGSVVNVNSTEAGGRWIISGSSDHGVHFWDEQTGLAHMRINAHKDAVNQIAVQPGRSTFATASRDGLVRIWKYSSFV